MQASLSERPGWRELKRIEGERGDEYDDPHTSRPNLDFAIMDT